MRVPTKEMTESLSVNDAGKRAPVSMPGSQPEMHAIYMTEALVEIESNHNILGYLSTEQCERVLGRASLQIREAGDHVFAQGEPHEGIFLIQSGRVRTYYVSPVGREITLAYWTPGHFVGGPEIFGGGRHVWSAVAMEACRIAFLSSHDIRSTMREIPEFAIGLIEGLVYKGKCYSALLQILGTRPATGRLAHLLLTLAKREGVHQDSRIILTRRFSHEEFSNMVGATRQWITASLRRFERSGLISYENQRMVILDRMGLERICQ